MRFSTCRYPFSHPRRTSRNFIRLFTTRRAEVAGHGEPDPLVAAALAEDSGVDAHQVAGGVDERAA